MTDVEQVLRDGLRKLAERVQPDPTLPRSAVRRTRRRQAALSVAVAAVVAAVGAGGFVIAEALNSHRISTSVSPGPHPTPRQIIVTPAPTSLPRCKLGWTVSPQPDPPYADQLKAISGTAWNDVWAVGGRFPQKDSLSAPLIEHWDGRTWTVVLGAPETADMDARLTGVAAMSKDDVWAVGSPWNRGNSIVEHWDGSRWSMVAFPSPPHLVSLDRIVALTSDDVWILGHAEPGGSFSSDVFIHWDGRSWSLVAGPDPVDPHFGTSAVQSLAASGPRSIWAGGGVVQGFSEAGQPVRALLERWDGEAWRVVEPPRGSIATTVLSATPDGELWAARGGYVGTVGSYGFEAPDVLYHWDGKEWNLVRRVHQGRVMALVARSSADVWVIGSTNDAHTFVDHWDGMKWVAVVTPDDAIPTVGELLPTATITVDGSVIVFSADYPSELGGGGQSSDAAGPNNYLWARCP